MTAKENLLIPIQLTCIESLGHDTSLRTNIETLRITVKENYHHLEFSSGQMNIIT